MIKLIEVHEIAMNILDEVGDARRTEKPNNDNTAWHEAWYAWKAREAAHKALHERDKTKANYFIRAAIDNTKKWRGES